MFETKAFQVRDEGTHIPVLATLILSNEEDRVFRRAGYGKGCRYILLTNLITRECQHDPEKWEGGRTMKMAHRLIERNWLNFSHNCVVDVQYLSGETDTPKEPE